MADLAVVTLSELINDNQSAKEALKKAVREDGFFYLNLQGYSNPVLEDVNACYQLAKDVFDLPLEEKMKYDIDNIGPHKLNGYKPEGRNAGVAEGKSDGFEAYLIPKDELCEVDTATKLIGPEILMGQQDKVRRFVRSAHEIGLLLLRLISHGLKLPLEDALENYHRVDRRSTGAFGMLKYPRLSADSPQLGHSAHIDVGSLTILFCNVPGLQIRDPKLGKWEYVQPKEGHAVVNAGDSLRFLTAKRVCSCLHRVVPGPDATIVDRYSLAYFMRPELDAVLVDEGGEKWRSVEWHERKYKAFRATIGEQKKDSVLTGKAGYIGRWSGYAEVPILAGET